MTTTRMPTNLANGCTPMDMATGRGGFSPQKILPAHARAAHRPRRLARSHTDIANARLVVIEECGHMAPLEKPAEVSAALRRWLTQ